MALLLCGLACLGACVNGEADDSASNSGPECYSNANCPGGRECSAGICVGFTNCTKGCRNNEDCLDNVCRLQCEAPADCEDQGLTCGTDTQHCKPAPNPTPPQTQTKSGTGGTTATGTGGTGAAGMPASTAGAPAAAAGRAG